MTVSALVTRNDITATASQTSFTYTFRVLEATDMDVYQNGALLASGYTVNDVGVNTGGTVTLDVGVPVGQIVSLVLAMPLDRTTNYQNSGDFLAGDVNGDFDKIYIGAIQNENEGGRSLRLKDVEPPTAGVDMTIPLKADRLGKFLAFDSVTGGPIAGSGAAFFDSAAWSVYDFTGDGSTVAFTLGSNPATENNTQVYIDGVYQQKDGYSVAGAVLTFSVAPPNLSTIEVMVVAILPIGSTSSDLVSYAPAGTGAVASNVQTKLRESVSVKDFGAVGDGTTDDTDAIQAAINSSAGRILIPEGNYKITDKNGAYGLLIAIANKTIVGDGLELSNLVYTSSAINRPAISVTASDVHIKGIRVDGTANATKAAQTRANCNGITFLNVSECSVRTCQIVGGHYGIYLDNDTGSYDNNDHNIVESNILRNFQSTGFIAHQAQYLLVQGNDAEDCKNDGFKISEGTQFSRILGNTSRNNDRDGFDVYSGFIESVLNGNVAEDNQLQGYEIKGTFGGGDYVVRNSVISNNVATRNGLGGTHPGFSIISVRNCTFDGNISVSNTGSGFDFNTVQGCTVTGCLATRNTQHGFDLSANVSRTQFSGCQSVDNSWVNGTTQNGTYHGYNLESASTGQFVGCMSMNGTTTGQKGGQGYGWYWPTAISGSRVQNCYTLANVTGGFGGGTGWASANGFFNVTDNGTLKGVQFTDDALSKMSMTGAFNEMAIVDGITAPATVSGKTFIYVDTADGDLKVKFGDGTIKTISTDT
jgi:hypothetical protein